MSAKREFRPHREYSGFQVTEMNRRILGGLKFPIPGLFGGRKIWQVFFGWLNLRGDFLGIQSNLKNPSSALVSQPQTQAIKRLGIRQGRIFCPGIFLGMAGRPRDFFFLPHSIVPVTWNLEYPFGELTVLEETFDAKKPYIWFNSPMWKGKTKLQLRLNLIIFLEPKLSRLFKSRVIYKNYIKI